MASMNSSIAPQERDNILKIISGMGQAKIDNIDISVVYDTNQKFEIKKIYDAEIEDIIENLFSQHVDVQNLSALDKASLENKRDDLAKNFNSQVCSSLDGSPLITLLRPISENLYQAAWSDKNQTLTMRVDNVVGQINVILKEKEKQEEEKRRLAAEAALRQEQARVRAAQEQAYRAEQAIQAYREAELRRLREEETRKQAEAIKQAEVRKQTSIKQERGAWLHDWNNRIRPVIYELLAPNDRVTVAEAMRMNERLSKQIVIFWDEFKRVTGNYHPHDTRSGYSYSSLAEYSQDALNDLMLRLAGAL